MHNWTVVYADGVSTAAVPVISPRERLAGGCRRAAVEPDLGHARALELAASVKALGDPTRLRILDTLRKAAPEAICQCELTPLFDLSQQALSKHLKVLERAGLITRGREAQWRPCRIEGHALKEVDDWLERYRRIWDQRLDRLDDYIKVLQAREKKRGRKK